MPETIASFIDFQPGQKANAADFNTNFSALRGTRLPIDVTSAAASTDEYDLGSSSYKWKRAYISGGFWNTGDMKAHMSYNGHVGPGQGWMLCDGRLINQTNYDAEHGSGSWDTYVGSSTIQNRYLPNMTNKYLVGDTLATENGIGTIGSTGNTTMTLNLAHTHTNGAHSHAWYRAFNTSTSTDYTYDTSGNTLTVGIGTVSGSGIHAMDGPTVYHCINTDGFLYTNKQTTTGDSQLSNGTSVQPTSIQVQYYMMIL